MIQPPGQILRQCFLIASPQKENSMWLPFSRFFAQVSFFRAPRLTMYPWKKMELSFYVIFCLGMVECSSSSFFQKTCQSSTAGMHSVEKTCPKPPLNLPSWLHQTLFASHLLGRIQNSRTDTAWVDQRKFRNQISNNMERWNAEKRREESEERKYRRARNGRKVAKHCVFPMICGSGGWKSRRAKATGA